MQCNIARAGAGAGGNTGGTWELIEEIPVGGLTGYTLERKAEPDGTPYVFSTMMVEIVCPSALSKYATVSGYPVVTTEQGTVPVAMDGGKSVGFKLANTAALWSITRVGDLLNAPTQDSSAGRTVDDLRGNITKLYIAFMTSSSYAAPSALKFRIYAMRA